MKKFTAFLNNESGATAIEYGLIAALISIVCIIALRNVGISLNQTYSTINDYVAGANN